MGAPDRRCDVFFGRLTRWQEEMAALRALLLDGPLDEAFKWRQPVYVLDGGNVATLWGFRDRCGLGFFKGVLLTDPEGLLVPPGPNSRAVRMAEFTDAAQIRARKPLLRALIAEAVANERAGRKVDLPKDDIAYPDELVAALEADPELACAFEALTPGRRRGWALHVAGAKQSATRERRVEKAREAVLAGKGFGER